MAITMDGIFVNGQKVTFHPENILTGDASAYTEEIGTAVEEWMEENVTGGEQVTDTTLTLPGVPADSKKTGDEIGALKADLKFLKRSQYALEGKNATTSNLVNVMFRLEPSHKYKLSLSKTTWEHPSRDAGAFFSIESISRTGNLITGSVSTTILYRVAYPTTEVEENIVFTVPKDSIYVQAVARILDTDKVEFVVQDIGAYSSTRYFGKISIIGDSIETFDKPGYKIDGYAMFYPHYDVTDISDTWWHKLIVSSDANLEVNASDAGSCVSNVRGDTHPDFFARASLVGNPDVVFVTLGTNDSNFDVPVGNYDFETAYENLLESEFRPAYIKGVKALQATYPNVKIVCIAEKMKDAYYESIEAIADRLGCEFVDCRDYTSIDSVHPGTYGMNQILNKILYRDYAIYEKVSNEISALREDVESIEPGLSDDAKVALIACFDQLLWKSDEGATYIDALKKALGMESKSDRRPELPEEYEQVEYIYGDGNQWTTLDIVSQIPFEVNAKILHVSGESNVFTGDSGAIGVNSNFRFLGYGNYQHSSLDDYGMRIGNNDWTSIEGYPLNEVVDIKSGVYMSGNNVNVYLQINNDEMLEQTLTNAPTTGYPMRIFKRDGDTWLGRRVRFYKLVCYSSKDNKIFDGIPCYRKSDGISGLYDVVSGNFYSSEGTEQFIVGDVIN